MTVKAKVSFAHNPQTRFLYLFHRCNRYFKPILGLPLQTLFYIFTLTYDLVENLFYCTCLLKIWRALFIKTFYFDIISKLQKSCKNSTRNICMLFTWSTTCSYLATFGLSFSLLNIFICVYIFSEPSENRLESWFSFAPKYFSVYFPRTRTFSCICTVIQLRKCNIDPMLLSNSQSRSRVHQLNHWCPQTFFLNKEALYCNCLSSSCYFLQHVSACR